MRPRQGNLLVWTLLTVCATSGLSACSGHVPVSSDIEISVPTSGAQIYLTTRATCSSPPQSKESLVVRVTSVNGGKKYTNISDSSGYMSFGIRPGRYTMTARARSGASLRFCPSSPGSPTTSSITFTVGADRFTVVHSSVTAG